MTDTPHTPPNERDDESSDALGMPADRAETVQIPPIDFDGAWKETLSQLLQEALDYFAPTLSADIDWAHGYKPLDSQLEKVAPDAEFGPLAADKLFEVRLRNGTDMWLYVHIEVQSQRDPDFARRMYVYNTLLYIRYHHDVWSLAILGDESPDWKPDSFQRGSHGLEATIRYPVVKLLDENMAALDAKTNPIVAVILAHRTAQRTRGNMALRAATRLELARRLYRLDYDAVTIAKLDRLVEWLLWLPPALKEQTWDGIQEIRKEYKMPFVTYGETKAKSEGLRAGINALINVRFKETGASLKEEIATIKDPDVLHMILEGLETAQTLDDVRALLPKATR